MLIVLASAHDAGARALVDRGASSDVRLMTPRDLSSPGWQHYIGDDGEEWAVVGGEKVRVDDIEGVVSRLPVVREEDLPHIAHEDRTYVATEMSAFLLSWLTRLASAGRPVLNRPTVSSLMGPSMSPEKWMLLAAKAGVTLASRRHEAPAKTRPAAVAPATVIGERCFGDVPAELRAQALRLACVAEVEVLTVYFRGFETTSAFACVDLLVDPSVVGVADALWARARRGQS